MGERYNAFLIQGDLGRADFELEGLQLSDGLPWERLRRRRDLLGRLDRTTDGTAAGLFASHRDNAFALL
jgi:hypothetical protein